MECDEHEIEQVPGAGRCSLKRKRAVGALGGLVLVCPSAEPVQLATPTLPPTALPNDSPFMSNMEEISYWVRTKRAPCLCNYYNVIKKQVEQAQHSTPKPPSIKTNDEEPSSKKRKLKLLKDDSVSTEKPQKIFLKNPQKQKPGLSSSKSKSDADSDIDFNIKMPATKKARNLKAQKRCLTRVPKKNKIVALTPKILRRSLRKAPQIFNDSNCNIAYDLINANDVNGKPGLVENKAECKDNEVPNDQSKVMLSEKGTKVLNGQLEDSSDVSGFTANYIRSTKIHSSKRPQKLRNQNSRAIAKQSKQRVQPDKMIICMNKSMNTGLPDTGAPNCSTDSSHNAFKLVTVKHNEQSTRALNKNTSLLKFIETKLEDCHSNSKIHEQETKSKLNISFQSRSSAASRYPRRYKNNKDTHVPSCSTNIDISKGNNVAGKYNMRKGAANLNPKRHLEEKVSRARSGRRKGVKLNVEETNPVVQLNSSMEQVSSTPILNIACPNTKSSLKNSASSRCLRSRTIQDKVGQCYKESSSEGSHKKLSDSPWEQTTPKYARKVTKTQDGIRKADRSRDLRKRSGFAACFSDSDSDSVHLTQHKFFC